MGDFMNSHSETEIQDPEARLSDLRQKYGPGWNHEEALWQRLKWLLGGSAYGDARMQAADVYHNAGSLRGSCEILRSFTRDESRVIADLDQAAG